MARPSGLAAIADRLIRRHTGVAAGLIDLHTDQVEVEVRGDGIGPDSLFEIGSITKTVTSLTLAVLAEAGTVQLSTPLRELLPPGTSVPTRGETEITLEHLARHTAGLPRSPHSLWYDLKVVEFQRGNPYAMDEATVLDGLTGVRLRKRPGTGNGRYSNLGAGLLGIALRRATGAADFQSLVTDAVLGPLEMSDTVVTPARDQASRWVQGHGLRRRPVDGWYLEGMAGAGALRSSAYDLLRYLRAQLEPARTPLATAIARTRVVTAPNRRHTIGLGWIRTRIPSGDLWWHNGGTGGFRSFAGFCPQRQRGAVVLVNDRRGPDRAGIELVGGVRRRS